MQCVNKFATYAVSILKPYIYTTIIWTCKFVHDIIVSTRPDTKKSLLLIS
jgi:hypothetical protein